MERSADRAPTEPSNKTRPRQLGLALRHVPWLWHNHVVQKTLLPLWALSILVLLTVYGTGVVLTALTGDLGKYLRDPRWLFALLPASGALTLGYIPRLVDRLWDNITPWLANNPEQVASLRAETPDLLTRFFWPGFFIWFSFAGVFAFMDQSATWAADYSRPDILKFGFIIVAPFYGYFVGGASAIAGVGLALLAARMGAQLDFKPGFILNGGKGSLQPFNRLLWVVWGTFTLPFLLLMLIIIATDTLYNTDRPLWGLTLAMQASLFLLSVASTIMAPQMSMNRLLAKEKAQELARLRGEMSQTAALPEGVDTVEILRRMCRHQYLSQELSEAKQFTPTMVDARLLLQIGTSVTAIILANVLMRMVF